MFDFGDISENSVAFGPDTAFIRLGATAGSRDTTWRGKTIQGLDTLDSERDPFSRAFNVASNDNGLPATSSGRLVIVYDTIPGPGADRKDSPVLQDVPRAAMASGRFLAIRGSTAPSRTIGSTKKTSMPTTS